MTANVDEDVEQGEQFPIVDGSEDLYSHYGNQHGGSLEVGNWYTSKPGLVLLDNIPKGCLILL